MWRLMTGPRAWSPACWQQNRGPGLAIGHRGCGPARDCHSPGVIGPFRMGPVRKAAGTSIQPGFQPIPEKAFPGAAGPVSVGDP
jgi:hypothetical protein